MRLSVALRYDVLFQFRHGFYYAYGLITLFYSVALIFVPMAYKDFVLVFLLFTDTTILGFFFVGGMMILEKGQGVYDGLFVTPLKTIEFFFSRVLSLTLLALIVSFIIILSAKGIPYNLLIFILAVILSSSLFTLVGMAIASKAKTVNGYFITSIGYTMILVFPMLDYLHLYSSKFFMIIPTASALFLLEVSLKGGNLLEIVGHFLYLFFWTFIAAFWAWKWFHRYVIFRIGGAK